MMVPIFRGDSYTVENAALVNKEVLPYFSPAQLTATTKSELTNIADMVVRAVEAGDLDALQTLIVAKKYLAIYESIEARVRAIAEGAFDAKSVSMFSAEVVQAESGVKYDYSVCNDPEWIELNARQEETKAGLKDAEARLKAMKKPATIVDEATGEVVRVQPPLRTAKLGLKITLK